jgi:ABC-type antimicrobial peptide transport system permease subunit
VIGQAVSYVAIGTLIGLTVSLLAMQSLRGLLYGVAPTDPLTILGVTLLLFIAAVSASLAPAQRAARLDPIRALKAE